MTTFTNLPLEIFEEILVLCDVKSFQSLFLLTKDSFDLCYEDFFQRYIKENYDANQYNITEWNISIFENTIFATSTWKKLFFCLNKHKNLTATVSRKGHINLHLDGFSIRFSDTYLDIIGNVLQKVSNIEKNDIWTIKIKGIFLFLDVITCAHVFKIYFQYVFGTLKAIVDPLPQRLNLNNAIGTLKTQNTLKSWFDNITSIEYFAGDKLVDDICIMDPYQKNFISETIL
jgi:hypothetical protein